MSDSQVKPEAEEEWRRSQCTSSSRTRPILIGQYPSSLSPSVLNSPPLLPIVNETTNSDHRSPHNNDNQCGLVDNDDDDTSKTLPPSSISPSPKSTTTKDNTIIEVQDETSSASYSSPVKLFSQGGTPDSQKNIKSLTTKNGRHGKESGKIPVGIAVAWQRLVTSASNTQLSTTDTTTMSCCSGTAADNEKGAATTRVPSTRASPTNSDHHHHQTKGKVSNPSSPCSSPSLQPKRPLSSSSAPGTIPTKDRGVEVNTKNNKVHQSKLSETLKSRPASVNSIPIHQQHAHHQQQQLHHHGMSTLQSNLTALMKQQQQYAHGGLNSPYADWPVGHLNVPHNYDNAAYIQQLSSLHQQQLHQQLQLSHGGHYGPQQLAHSGYVYGYSPERLQKYEQYLQQSEIQRHHQELQYHHQLHQQQQLQQEYEYRRATPIPSPRIKIPSPSPTTIHSGQTIWPPEFFHQNSSTALSPKSLTSTPSPVLVQDSSPSHYLLASTNSGGRRSTTPTNSTITTISGHNNNHSNNNTSSNNNNYGKNVTFTPVLPPKKCASSWKEVQVKISPVPKKLKIFNKIDENPIGDALDVSKLEEEVREERIDKKMLAGKKHDFTRLESLIEKREEVSVPLLNQQKQQQQQEKDGDDDEKGHQDIVGNVNKKYFDIKSKGKNNGDYSSNKDIVKDDKVYTTSGDGSVMAGQDGHGGQNSPQKNEIKNEVNRCCDVVVDGKQVPETKKHLSLPVVTTQSKLLAPFNSTPPPPPTCQLVSTYSPCTDDDSTNENYLGKTASLMMKMKRNDKNALNLNGVDKPDKDKQERSLPKSTSSLNKWDNCNDKGKSQHDFHTTTAKCIYDGDGCIDDKESASDNDSVTNINDSATTTCSKLNRDIKISSSCSTTSSTPPVNVMMDKVKVKEYIKKQEVEPLEYESKNNKNNNNHSIYCGSKTSLYNNKKTLQVLDQEKSDVKNPAAGLLSSSSSSPSTSTQRTKLVENYKSFSPLKEVKMEPPPRDPYHQLTPERMSQNNINQVNNKKPTSFVKNENQFQYHQQQQLKQHIPAGSNSLTTTTKCDNDIKVRAGSCLNSSSTSSAISDNSSLVYSRPTTMPTMTTMTTTTTTTTTMKREDEIKKQDNQLMEDASSIHHQQQQQKHQYTSEIGNRSYQLLNVPLPPPAPLSVDRKLIFKAENQQNRSDTIETKLLEHNTTLLLSQRFQHHQHHFLPIEQEHNHLNLLATVAQEFGNEIGSGSLIKSGQQLHHHHPVVDTYEFVEDVQEKIETFSQSQLALNTSRPSKIKTKLNSIQSSSTFSQLPTTTSTCTPTPNTITNSNTTPTLVNQFSQSQMVATTTTTTSPMVPPIVLKIPHITPSDRFAKKSKKRQPKSSSSRKSVKQQRQGQLMTTVDNLQETSRNPSRKRTSTTRKRKEPKNDMEKVVKTCNRKKTTAPPTTMTTPTKMTTEDPDNNNSKIKINTTGDDDHIVIKVKRKSKKQNIHNVEFEFVEQKSKSVEDQQKEEEGMPLKTEKKKSTSYVMKKGNRSSIGSSLKLQNQSKDDKPIIELVLPQVQNTVSEDKPSKKKEKSKSTSSSSTIEKSKRNKLLLLDEKLIMGGLMDGQSTKSRKKPSQKPNALSQDLTLQQNNNIRNNNKKKREKSTKISTNNTFNLNTNHSNKKKKKNTQSSSVSSSNLIDDNSLININTDGTGNSQNNNKTNILSGKSDENDMTHLRIEDRQLFSQTPQINQNTTLKQGVSSTAENDWAANPTYAVTAIKTDEIDEPESVSSTVSSSYSRNIFSTSVDTSSYSPMDNNDDVKMTINSSNLPSDKKDKRKSAKPSKLSKLTLMNVKNVTHNDSPTTLKPTTIVNQEHEQELFHVKSQLKSFVHFSPRKTKTSPTKSQQQQQSQHHIKPCLKAEPIVRTATSPERDYISDDEMKDIGIENIDLISTSNTTTSKLYSHLESQSLTPRRISLHREDKNQNSDNTLTTGNHHEFKFGVRIKHNETNSENGTIPSDIVDDNNKSAKVMNGDDVSDTLHWEKVVIESVAEMENDMRILTEIQGLFYTGKLNALQPPDVYGVTLDNERGAPPHLIFSAEEVLEKCIREVKPPGLVTGLRICAYWSKNYSGLYPGKVSVDYTPTGDPHNELIPIEFDDGDTGVIGLNEIRLLAADHPIREYDPNPLLTLEKKHRKRRHSSATGSQSGCSGDHEDADCGEPYCAKVGKFEETEEKHTSSRVLYWSWKGLGYKKPRSKKDRNKEFFDGIQRGDEVVNVGDSALFISSGNERPFIGRVERFWEKKGQKIVSIRWFYHPEEVKATNRRLQGLKYAGALFESPHIDENDVQTIARKCEVLPFSEFKEMLSNEEKKHEGANRSKRLSNSGELNEKKIQKDTKDGKSEAKEKVGCLTKWSNSKNTSQKGVYYLAGFYNPYDCEVSLFKDLK